MRRQLIIRPEAEADLLEAALWYEQVAGGLGLDLTLEKQCEVVAGKDGSSERLETFLKYCGAIG